MDSTPRPEMSPERLAEIRDFESSFGTARRQVDDRQLLDTAHRMLGELLSMAPPPEEPVPHQHQQTGELVAVTDRTDGDKMVVHQDGSRQRLSRFDFDKTYVPAAPGAAAPDLSLLSPQERASMTPTAQAQLAKARAEWDAAHQGEVK